MKGNSWQTKVFLLPFTFFSILCTIFQSPIEQLVPRIIEFLTDSWLNIPRYVSFFLSLYFFPHWYFSILFIALMQSVWYSWLAILWNLNFVKTVFQVGSTSYHVCFKNRLYLFSQLFSSISLFLLFTFQDDSDFVAAPNPAPHPIFDYPIDLSFFISSYHFFINISF
jgi:hypothetical protein